MDKLPQIIAYATAKLKNDKTGHGLDHLTRVAQNAKLLLKEEPQADTFIVLAACWLHDTIDEKLTDPKQAQSQLKAFLKQIGLTEAQIQAILAIITQMSFTRNLNGRQKLSLEGQLVQDADWLDAIGAIGCVRAIYYGGAHRETIYDPKIKPRTNLTKEAYRQLEDETIINHFYEKLLKIADMLNTQAAKELAQKRQKFMLAFLEEFKNEWNGLS